MKHKVGDKVIYSKVGAIDWESQDWAAVSGLKIGQTYTIKSVESFPDSVRVKESNLNCDIHPDHFAPINGGRDEAFDQLVDLAQRFGEATTEDEVNYLKEKICTTYIDPITVYQDRLNKIEEIAKMPRE